MPVCQLHSSALALQEGAEFLSPKEKAGTVKSSELAALKDLCLQTEAFSLMIGPINETVPCAEGCVYDQKPVSYQKNEVRKIQCLGLKMQTVACQR